MRPQRVLVVDDHPVVRDGLRLVLDGQPASTVVGCASDGAQAVELAAQLDPDVIVMDLHMPGMGGVEAVARIRAEVPGAAVLVLTMYEDDAHLLAALRAGARGYLLKGAGPEEIRAAVAAVARREAVLGPRMADRLLAHLARQGLASQGQAQARGAAASPFPHLTARELQVLELIATGLDNRQITERLVLSPKTVRNHVSTVLAKLPARDRSQAIVLGREAGLGVTRMRGTTSP